MSFADQVRLRSKWPWARAELSYKTAIFRQINKAHPNTHHDALEFPDGQIVLLTNLADGQQATVLQLPARPASMKAKEAPAVDGMANIEFANADRP